MLEVIATSPPQKPWLAVAPGQVLDEAKGGQQWGRNFKLVLGAHTYFQFVVLLANSVDAWVKLYLCLALCKFKTQVKKLNLRSRIKEITFYQRLWKYWSSTSSVKVRPGSYSESHWSCSAAFLTACSPTASSSCLFCCHSSSPLVRFPVTGWVNPLGATSPSTQYVAQSLRCWASVLSVGGTGGPAAGAWGHHMQHQHIARLAAQPGQPPAWLRSYVPGLLLDKEIEKEGKATDELVDNDLIEAIVFWPIESSDPSNCSYPLACFASSTRPTLEHLIFTRIFWNIYFVHGMQRPSISCAWYVDETYWDGTLANLHKLSTFVWFSRAQVLHRSNRNFVIRFLIWNYVHHCQILPAQMDEFSSFKICDRFKIK